MLTTRKNYKPQHGYKKRWIFTQIFRRYGKFLLLIRYAVHDFHFPHLCSHTTPSLHFRRPCSLHDFWNFLQRENLRCLGHATTRSIDRANCWLAAVHAPSCCRSKFLYRTFLIFITAVAFSSKSRSGCMLNPNWLSEVDFVGCVGLFLGISEEKEML